MKKTTALNYELSAVFNFYKGISIKELTFYKKSDKVEKIKCSLINFNRKRGNHENNRSNDRLGQ